MELIFFELSTNLAMASVFNAKLSKAFLTACLYSLMSWTRESFEAGLIAG